MSSSRRRNHALGKVWSFTKNKAQAGAPRTILGLGGENRNNLIADGKDRKLRDSVVVTVHTRNIGETF